MHHIIYRETIYYLFFLIIYIRHYRCAFCARYLAFLTILERNLYIYVYIILVTIPLLVSTHN